MLFKQLANVRRNIPQSLLAPSAAKGFQSNFGFYGSSIMENPHQSQQIHTNLNPTKRLETRQPFQSLSQSSLVAAPFPNYNVHAQSDIQRVIAKAKKPKGAKSDGQMVISNAMAPTVVVQSEKQRVIAKAKKPKGAKSDSQMVIANAKAPAVVVNSESQRLIAKAKKPKGAQSDGQKVIPVFLTTTGRPARSCASKFASPLNNVDMFRDDVAQCALDDTVDMFRDDFAQGGTEGINGDKMEVDEQFILEDEVDMLVDSVTRVNIANEHIDTFANESIAMRTRSRTRNIEDLLVDELADRFVNVLIIN